MDEGFLLNVLYLVSNTFQVGLGHHLGVLEPYLWCPQIERKGSRDPPWDHGESGRWEIGSPLTYSSQFVPWSKNINSGVSFAVLAAGDQALLSFDVLIHILAFLGYCGYCVSDPRTFHQIFVNPEIDMRYKLNNLRCFFLGLPKFDVSPHSLLHRWNVKAQICTDVGRSLHSRRRHSQHSQHRQHLMFGTQQCPGPGLFGHNFQ